MTTRLARVVRHTLPALVAALLLGACTPSADGETVRFRVPPGSGMRAVADTLAQRELIRWPQLFVAYGRYRGAAASLKPGVYEVERGATWNTLLDRLVRGDVVTMRLAVPEGWTSQQIAARIAESSGAPVDSVLALLADSALMAEWEVPGPTFEGYLYPATYSFPAGTPPVQVLRTLYDRYRRVWTPERRARADSLGMSEQEVVTLASIVEREARVWEERPVISGVFHNRLRIGMPLQADPTVQYARGEHASRLLYAHIEEVRDNPYNTYTHRGLPPGPIASPSAGAIDATLSPAPVDFLYFVARPDGRHIFTRTLREHNLARGEAARLRDAQAAPQQQPPAER